MTTSSARLPGFGIEPHRAELAALLRLLSLGKGCFSLSIAVCNAPSLRDRLIAEVLGNVPTVKVLSIPAETVDVYGFVRDQGDLTHADGLFLIGMEASLSDAGRDQPTLRSLNASRDLWPERFPLPVVFWLPEYAARTLSETARDFWRIRSHRFSFLIRDDGPVLGSAGATSGSFSAAVELQFDEKLARIAELKERLAKAGEPTPELHPHILAWLFELSRLHQILGELDAAEAALERVFDITGRDSENSDTAGAWGNLGVIYQIRGELDQAEKMFLKALEINERLGNQFGMASQNVNLGLIYRQRGELDRAEQMFKMALAINEKLGRQESMAGQYGNLGLIYRRRGDLSRAEEMHQKSLAIFEKIGREEGIASQYGNLGPIYRQRGELDRAEEMLKRALAINEKLGDQESIAIQCSNLGWVAKDRGDLVQARKLWTKARDLFAKIGMPHEMKKYQAAIDGLSLENV